MPDGSRNDRITLRDADTLIRAGLVATALRDAVTAVERRYAVAITPAMQALIASPTTRSAGSSSLIPQNW